MVAPTSDVVETYEGSCATSHFFSCASALFANTLVDIQQKATKVADNTTVSTTQKRDVVLPFSEANLTLIDVLVFLDIGYNLISVIRMAH